MGSAVEPSFMSGNIGHITDPYLIGGRNRKVLTEKIVCYRECMFRICSGPKLPYLFTADAEFFSDTPYSAYAECDATSQKITLQSFRSKGSTRPNVGSTYLGFEACFFQGPL